MKIKLNLSKTEILQLVKAKTHKKGAADLALNGDKAVKQAYNEQASDDPNDVFLLMSSLRSSLDAFKSYLSDYIVSDGSVSADNITDTLSDDNESFELSLDVSERFNVSMTQPLADLGSRFIENSMLMTWFATIAPSDAKVYSELLEANKADISRCFLKVRPDVPSHDFPTKITISDSVLKSVSHDSTNTTKFVPSKNVDTTGLTAVPLAIGTDKLVEFSLPKTTDGGIPIDDVRMVTSSSCVTIGLEDDGYHFRAAHVGTAVVTLYSYHKPNVYSQFLINVTSA